MSIPLKYQSLRDLVWAITSPPILEPVDQACQWYTADWYKGLYPACEPFFHDQAMHHDALQSLLESQNDRRLGKYFECLWLYWLKQSSRYDVIAHNLPMRDGSETLGELDFLVLDKTTRECMHWELAVKFYLGMGDTRMHGNWYGPKKRDRLDKKVAHLRQRQTKLTDQPAVREILHQQGIHVDSCGVILKGRLFYPQAIQHAARPAFSSPQHQWSQWYSISDFIALEASESEVFLPLLGHGWMVLPVETDVELILDKSSLLNAIKSRIYRLPLCVARGEKGGWQAHIFLVEDDWKLI